MAQTLNLSWNRCTGDRWGDLFAVDLSSRHFDGLIGVYLAWSGGQAPTPLAAGQGPIREMLAALREEPALAPFRGAGVFVTWARAEPVLCDGIERFLVETLQPKVRRTPPAAPIVEVNLPGREPLAAAVPAVRETSQPDQIWDDMAAARPSPQQAAAAAVQAPPAPAPIEAAPVAVAPRKITRLQAAVNAILEKRSKAAKPAGGFFGGSKPKDEKESLVGEVMQAILEEAVGTGASDIHIEPQESATRVRLRVDGVLDEALVLTNGLELRLVSYIRVLCNLDPEKGVGTGKPEDGRMAVNVAGKEADLRLSTFPTGHGDKAVLRVIPRGQEVPTLTELGLRPETIASIEEMIHRPQGMIVVTGPTGSGKSTTLYTLLQRLNDRSRNIVTLEDPIEKKIPGVSQGVLAPKAGFTFSEGLRAILRQDPNVIMVGEIRDVETAEIAMSAALTGHMLLTTLHTNSAVGAVSRLLDMGLEPFLISSALTAVFAQRLARRLCPDCREPGPVQPAEREQILELGRRAGLQIEGIGDQTYRGRGCSSCRDTGYRGRLVLFETVRITPALRELILAKASIDQLRTQALKDGSELLVADGLLKAAAGLTTLAELARVVTID